MNAGGEGLGQLPEVCSGPEVTPNGANLKKSGRNIWFVLIIAATVLAAPAFAQQPQNPNIRVIIADNIGYWNVSPYNRGMMGCRTPNIDRIANDGAIFTHNYGQQSRTARRAVFITGQSPLRRGAASRELRPVSNAA